jgi:Cof subfamily protein (haloacid dehalogenase superfamily)
MIKLVAIDLDGTLFNPSQQITPVSKKAVHQLLEAGIQPVIVTGRGRSGAEAALEMLDLDIPYICSSGALIRAGQNGEIISARTLHKHDEIEAIIRFARRTNAALIADTLDGVVWFGPDTISDLLDPMTSAYTWQNVRTNNPELDFDHPLLKLTIVGGTDQLKMAQQELDANCPSIHYVYAGMSYMDLTERSVNKGSALEILAQKMDIFPEEIAAIGDQPIDQSMLHYAGLPVAMGNAPDSLKEIALWIAPTNEQDGVAWVVKKIISFQGQA